MNFLFADHFYIYTILIALILIGAVNWLAEKRKWSRALQMAVVMILTFGTCMFITERMVGVLVTACFMVLK